MAELSTYQDVIDLVRSLIKDPALAGRLATPEQIDIWANTSLYELGEHAEYIDAEDMISLTAGTGAAITVGTNGGYFGVWRAEIDDETIYPTTTARLYNDNREWQTHTGEPLYYYMDSMANDYTSEGVKLGVWPLASGSYSLRLISTVAADVLESTSATDKVMLPLWAVPGLAWGILSKFYEAETRMQNLKVSAFYRVLFDETMTRLRARSFSRMNLRKAWGEGGNSRSIWDSSRLFPEDGIPVP